MVEVLDQKLGVILDELGGDKRGDILESLSTRSERLYVDAILEPDALERSARDVTTAARDEVVAQALMLELMSPRVIQPAVSSYMDIRETVGRASAARMRLLGARAPERGTLDALRNLPEVALGEPVPLLPAAGISGWWGCFEISDARRRRTCFALFTPDEGGLVRPDVAERCWIVLASGGTSETAAPPEPAQFDALLKLGRDYGYHAWEQLASRGVPTLSLRLLVRVSA